MVAAPPADSTPALTASATANSEGARSEHGANVVDDDEETRTLGDVAVHGVDDDSDFGGHCWGSGCGVVGRGWYSRCSGGGLRGGGLSRGGLYRLVVDRLGVVR